MYYNLFQFIIIYYNYKVYLSLQSLLQSSDIDINMIGSGGFSPLQLAAQSDQAKLCTLLVSYNSDRNP